MCVCINYEDSLCCVCGIIDQWSPSFTVVTQYITYIRDVWRMVVGDAIHLRSHFRLRKIEGQRFTFLTCQTRIYRSISQKQN